MANSYVLTWSPTNWITVVLMAAVGFAALGTVSQVIRSKGGAGVPSA